MQYGSVGDVFYFNFAVNETGGAGKSNFSVSWALRKCGRPITDEPVDSGTTTIADMTHIGFNNGAGCAELSYDSTDLDAGSTYAMYAWVEMADTTTPVGMVGQFKLTENGAIPGTATASPPGQTTGYATTYDEDGVVETGVVVTCQLLSVDESVTGAAYDSAVRSETSNGSGLVQFTGLFPGATYEFKRRASSSATANGFRITIPTTWAEDTFPLPPIIGTP